MRALARTLLLWLYLLLMNESAHADCQLKAEQIADTNRVFAFRNEERGHYYPLRLSLVRVSQTLQLLCNENDVRNVKCQSNGQFSPALPLSDCKKPLKVSVEPVDDDSCEFTMYRVGYKLNSLDFLEIYRSCYDVSNIRAHFVVHLAYPNSLASSRPEQTFTRDGIISGTAAASFGAKSVYQRFHQLLGNEQQYVKSSREMLFDRSHLAPSADFAFEQYMRQTFKYINVLPQFRTINRSNWKRIENWIRKQLDDGRFDALLICTGGLGVLQLPDTADRLKSIYLGEQQQNPVPMWLYKIVSNGDSSRFVFLVYNNVYTEKAPRPNCREVACPATLQLTQTKEAGFGFCCEAADFIKRNLPYLKNTC